MSDYRYLEDLALYDKKKKLDEVERVRVEAVRISLREEKSSIQNLRTAYENSDISPGNCLRALIQMGDQSDVLLQTISENSDED
jgi:hypothetical protein